MELLVIFVGLILFDLAAVRWGSDSRRLVSSCEEWLAAQGFAWGDRSHMRV